MAAATKEADNEESATEAVRLDVAATDPFMTATATTAEALATTATEVATTATEAAAGVTIDEATEAAGVAGMSPDGGKDADAVSCTPP